MEIEKKKIEPINTQEGIRQRDEAREMLLEKFEKEKNKN